MTAQQLRNSILQQAIQGRLVPQDPNDEPASVLLERIRKEKEQLVKEGKLKKKDLVTTPIADDEKQFDLPKGWEWVNIDQIATVKGGKRLPVGEKFSDIPTPYIYIRVTEMKNNTLQDNDLRYISAELHELLKNYTIHSTDLYLTIAGTIGAVGDVPEKFDGMNLTENALKLTNLQVDKKFLIYCLSSDFVQSQFKDKTNKVGQPKLAMERVKSTVFPLPPLAEQRRIVAKIEELMPLVEKYGKAQTELDTLNQDLPRRLRQSVLQQAIQGKLVSQDKSDGTGISLYENICKHKEILCKSGQLKSKDVEPSDVLDEEIPFDIPESWKWCHMGDLISMRMGKTPPRGDSQYWSNANLPWVSISDMKDYGHVKSTKEYVSQYAADHAFKEISPVGSLLMSFKLTVGRTSILEIPAYHNEAIITINPYVDDDYAFRNYLFYLLPVLANLGDSKDAIKGKTLNSTSLYNLLIPLPPLAEQRRIVAKIEELFAEIDKLK